MISWVIIAILVILAVFALKVNKMRHRIWIIAIILLALFLYTSVTLIYSNSKVELSTAEGIFQAGKVYLGWLGNGFQNLKVITGNVIKMDWASTNGTFFNKTEIEAEKI